MLLFDVIVVRLLLILAVMHLLADAAWSIPVWLDRILPNVDAEDASLECDPVPVAGDRERDGERLREGV